MKSCIAYCTCERFDYKDLISYLEEKYKVIKYKKVLLIEDKIWKCFIFDYWAIVSWWLEDTYLKKILEDVKKYEINSYNENIIEEFYFEENSENWKLKIQNDVISLASNNNEEKLAISHWLAQTTKLEFFEKRVETTIRNTKNIPIDLKEKGNIKLSKKQISQMRWELFLTKSSINLDYELLDEPDFFWDYPELSEFYKSMSNYVEIKTRIEVLNKKLEVIHELFQMLSDEQDHKHSSLLEWIIIWLIVLEIFFTIFHDILWLF